VIDDSGLRCWGYNDYGQTSVPPSLENPFEVAAGGDFTCAIDATGVRCWGRSFVPDELFFGTFLDVPALGGAGLGALGTVLALSTFGLLHRRSRRK
jgi:hypothetical protein